MEHIPMNRRMSYATIPLPSRVLYPDSVPPTVVVMVGLPARGKTYISRRMTRYLNWMGCVTRVFNVGEYRRKATESDDGKLLYGGHDFFRPDNEEAVIIRNKAAQDALEDMANWVDDENGQIAVFDATNTTRDRRHQIQDFCNNRGFQTFFVESICFDQELINENILEVKVTSPDYSGMEPSKVVSDFMQRIKHYADVYEPLDEALDRELSFIKIIDQGERFHVNRVRGTIMSKLCYFLMNLRVAKRAIYLTRHAESEDNVAGKIGGDSGITERGRAFAIALGKYMKEEVEKQTAAAQGVVRMGHESASDLRARRCASPTSAFASFPSLWANALATRGSASALANAAGGSGFATPTGKDGKQSDVDEAAVKLAAAHLVTPLRVWTSHLKRAMQTAAYIKGVNPEPWKALNEIDAGVCEGLSYEEIKEKYPMDFAKRDMDKYHYRYPGGESYQDLVSRLEPVIMELERHQNVLVICHQAVARCLLAYFADKSSEELPYLEVPLHTVLKLTPRAYGCEMEKISFNIEAVNTHRPKPQNIMTMPHATVRVQQNRLRSRRPSGPSVSPPPLTPCSSSTALSSMTNGSAEKADEQDPASSTVRALGSGVPDSEATAPTSPTHARVRFSVASDDMFP